ncbi:MAG TPA: NusG domain II-containing protein [Syntrophomonas sp.]|nr:NusG domain II-containing protein [Syntrophomonas sp.]HRW12650.1 NusG domain II-containing protein [Syntrophomonas sp.]
MRKKEWVLLVSLTILIVLVAGAIRYLQQANSGDSRVAVITQDGRLVERIDLQRVREPRQITLPGKYHEVVEVEPGRIRFKQADCPDKICVNTGWLEDPGDVAVCMPNRAVVRIED